MKNIILIIISILLLNSGCEEDDKSPVEQLPPATQEGLYTFGCLVNGQAWTPKGYTGIANLDVSYDPTRQGGTFDIATYRILSEENRQYMYIYSIGVNKTGTYSLNNVDKGASTFTSKCMYDRDVSVYRKGSLTITKFDLETRIISGTFEFTLAKPGCDTVRVTEGRFDMKI